VWRVRVTSLHLENNSAFCVVVVAAAAAAAAVVELHVTVNYKKY
jgi:hypothetical protein